MTISPTDTLSSGRTSPRLASRRRSSSTSFAKKVQHVLGPRVATQRNLALFLISLQSLVILLLCLKIIANNNAIAKHSSCGIDDEEVIGRPPPENSHPVRQALENADYDDMSPAVTGYATPIKYSKFLGRFMRCKPRPCDIDHWAYIGEKCFYREDDIKDRAGHNSSIWSLVQDDWYYTVDNDFACPVSICRRQWEQELNYTRQIVLRVLIEHYQNESTPWEVERMYVGNKYVRVNSFWGLEYKLNGGFSLTRTDANGVDLIEDKNASITIRRGFTQKFCDVSINTEVPIPTDPVYVVVPYTGRVDQLRLFYQNVKELLDAKVSIRVIISTFGGPVQILGAAELLREMQIGLTEGELSDGHLIQVVEAEAGPDGKFSRSKALISGMQYVPAEGLVFMCDVDMTIKKQFFENCRYNTKRNYQVYYPIVYSLYPYGNRVSKEHGYWRKGAFGMVCAYKSDYVRTWAWKSHTNQRTLRGWGYEDVKLQKEFANHWQISIFHAIEPNLLHRWHPKYCEFNFHIAACLGTVFQNMGSQQFLAAIVANKGIDVRNVPYDPAPVNFPEYKNDSAGSEKRRLEVPMPEGETDDMRWEELRKTYEAGIKAGKGGLLSIFAKEAIESLDRISTQPAEGQKNEHPSPGDTLSSPDRAMTQAKVTLAEEGPTSGTSRSSTTDPHEGHFTSEKPLDHETSISTGHADEAHEAHGIPEKPLHPDVPVPLPPSNA